MEETTQQRGWFARNWMWVVPVGCLLPIVGCVVIFGGAAWFGLSAMKGSPYMASVMAVSMNPEVQAALGDSLQPGQPPQADVMPGPGTNQVDFQYTLTGPKGTGKVHVVADRTADGWNYTTHTVTIDGTGEVINVPISSGLIPTIPPPAK
jgi:hypothetical protein